MVEYWKVHIHERLRPSKPNALAILTEPSDLFCIDVDVASTRDKRTDEEKRAGTELWDELVAEHGEPATLKAVTGSGGFHFYFSRSGTIGLNRRNNFSGLKVAARSMGSTVEVRVASSLLRHRVTRESKEKPRVTLGHPRAMEYPSQCPHGWSVLSMQAPSVPGRQLRRR
jgi:hypothetical protein